MKRLLLHPILLWPIGILLWIGIVAISVANSTDAADIQRLRRERQRASAAADVDKSVQLITAGIDLDQPRQRVAFQRLLKWTSDDHEQRISSEHTNRLAGNGLYVVHIGHHPSSDEVCDASVIFLMTYSGHRCIDVIVHEAKPNQYYKLQYLDLDRDSFFEILSLPFDDISKPGAQDGGVGYRITDRGFVKM